jgi:predicted RNase H-like nuclease (RuvC/YqgF family)
MMNLLSDLGISPDVAKISSTAILGGIAFKVIERFLNGKSFVEEHTTLRAELREELDAVRQEVVRLRTEVDSWREKYYEQLNITSEMQAELTTLRHELTEYKDRVVPNE